MKFGSSGGRTLVSMANPRRKSESFKTVRFYAAALFCATVLCSLGICASARAQNQAGGSGYHVVTPNYPVYSGGGYGGYGGYGWGGGGTVAGNAMQGMASVISAAGQANLANSAAANNWEQAYSADLSNRLQATNTYFEMRRVNQAATAEAQQAERPTAEELARYAKEAAPARLSASQLDPVTGEIAWPTPLREARYDTWRVRVEQQFAIRESAGPSPSTYKKLREALDELRANFTKHINDYPPQTYISARKFLDSLDYESRFAG